MSTFGELINVDTPVLFGFFAEWENNDDLNLMMRNIASMFQDKCKCILIDIENNKELSEALRIKGLPTYILYHRGEMKLRVGGDVKQEHIEENINVLINK